MVCYFFNFIAYQNNKKIVREKKSIQYSFFIVSQRRFLKFKNSKQAQKLMTKMLIKTYLWNYEFKFLLDFFYFYVHYLYLYSYNENLNNFALILKLL